MLSFLLSRHLLKVDKLVPEVCIRRCKLDTLHEADHSVSLFSDCLDNDQD